MGLYTANVDQEQNSLNTHGLCLLSFDGGGVRGLSSLYILKVLMDSLNYGRPPQQSRLKPCDIFDLMGGTSTGGLIAIMLGRLEMDVDECIEAYLELMQEVFEKESKRKLLYGIIRNNIEGRFSAEVLEEAISKVIIRRGAKPTDLFNDGASRRCRVFVCCFAQDLARTVRMRSYDMPDGLEDHPPTILQAARATSAATTYFPPVKIGTCEYVDGALGANNPVEEVELEASSIWCEKGPDLKPLVKCLISIGTGGKPETKGTNGKAIMSTVKMLVKIITETEETAKNFMAKWIYYYEAKRYFRFNVDQGLQDIQLGEYKRKGDIENATRKYLCCPEVKVQTRNCVENLRLKQGPTSLNFSETIEKERTQEVEKGIYRRGTRWYVPFDRNTNFAGREALLDGLKQRLKDHTMEKMAIMGLGGVGKTHLVLELAYRVREDCAVYWIPVNSRPNIQRAYTELAVRLKLPGSEQSGANAPDLVQKHLSNEATGPWLLVLDNADDIDLLTSPLSPESTPKSLVEYLPQGAHGSVIYTTRNRKAAVDLAGQNITDVPELGEPEAAVIFSSYLTNKGLAESETEARQSILKELTYLPLAIVQAASYINKNGISLSQYRDLLLDHGNNATELLNKDFHDNGRIPHTENAVAKSWIISFQQICRDDPLAANCLSLMACISPNNIPVSALTRGSSEVEGTDAIGTLDAYSFIKKRSDGEFLDMHRLVHLCTRGWLKRKHELPDWDKKATKQLGSLLGEPLGKLLENSSKAHLAQWSAYIPHAEFAISNAADDDNTDELIDLTLKCGDCLYHDGLYNRAEEMYWKVVEHENKRDKPEYQVTFSCLNNIGLVFLEQGKLQEAEAMHTQALELRKAMLGLEHPHTATSMNILGLIFQKQGRFQEAETMHRQAFISRLKMLNLDDPFTLMSMDNLGFVICEQGRCQEAEDILLEASERSQEVLGLYHPHTLSSLHNLGLALLRQGKINDAHFVFQKTLEGREKVLGPEHPHTLISKDNLGLALWQQHKLEEAEAVFQQALNTRERVLEPEDPQILNNMHNLGIVLFYEDRCEESQSFYQQALRGRMTILGPEHPDTLKTMFNLASVFYKQNKLEEARFTYEYGLQSNIKVFGPEHPNTKSSMHNLGLIKATTGRKNNLLKLEWKDKESEQE